MKITKSNVRIKHDGSLEDLAGKLSADLSLAEFWYKSHPDPPHTTVAYSECLGHEIALYTIGEYGSHCFELLVEPSVSVEDIVDVEVANTSEWLAKHIGIVSSLDCTVH